jgi:hypothetical protein
MYAMLALAGMLERRKPSLFTQGVLCVLDAVHSEQHLRMNMN